ncbi:hypothetical protein J19TS2_13980 [Cohnella xylanilytica]|uniref:Uncharacterized protein n=1 Tax=Cohnella xylanilytica TaxID=557555 RepID=A0A841TYW8_9BACL|nr:hypothetical protein [Cohnella xylanilytica]MBB6692302.1 hypothetical protein [Cohnella xylanilytica]GIO11843.1 hypothetical protein J19TS2_13980 [Cohnella xylanilytica]
MELTDVSNVSPGLFVTGVIFILLVGSLLSLGVLRFFQQRKRQGSLFMVGSVLSFVAMVLVVDRWFA